MENMFISSSSNVWNQRFHKQKPQVLELNGAVISSGGVDCATKVGALCAQFVEILAPVKPQVENCLSNIFNLWVQTIGVSDQDVFTLKDSGLHDEKGKNHYKRPAHSSPEATRSVWLYTMTAHPDQADPKFKHNPMTLRECAQFQLYADGIDAIIDNKMLKTLHIIIFHLAALENGRNPDISTLKEDRGELFQIQMRISFPFFRDKDLRMDLLIMRTRSFLLSCT